MVSVVIRTYNRAGFLAQALRSVLAQTFQDFEVIVLDDGSTDNTRQVVDSFQDPRIQYHYQENQGMVASHNRVVALAKGEYIAFLDDDDTWLPQKLEIQMRTMESSPWLGLVYCDAFESGAEARPTLFQKMGFKAPPQGSILRQVIGRYFIANSTALVPKRVFERVGLFDEAVTFCEDWDMWLRIAHSYEVGVVPLPLARVRVHPGQNSQRWERGWLDGEKTLRKAMANLALSPEELHAVRLRMAHFEYKLGSTYTVKGRTREGRPRLLSSLRLNPWQPRAYFFLATSLLGGSNIARIRAFLGKGM